MKVLLDTHALLWFLLGDAKLSPFDRLIVAQALEDGLALVSADRILDLYAVPRIW